MGSLKRNSLFFSVAALTAFACGGIDEPNFFSAGGTTTTTTHDGGASNTTDGGHGTTSDAGDTTTFDSGVTVTPDAGVTPTDPGIFCGTGNYCDPNSQFCCATGQDLGTPDFACGTSKNDCTNDPLGGVVIPCDKAAECPGQICCGNFQSGSPSQYTQVRCASSCAGTNDRIFCDIANGDADCNGAGTCVQSQTLPGFYVCGS